MLRLNCIKVDVILCLNRQLLVIIIKEENKNGKRKKMQQMSITFTDWRDEFLLQKQFHLAFSMY